MTNSPRTLKCLHVSTAAGGDPDVIEALEDCREAYGDWPEVMEICNRSPVGQCQYAAWFYNHRRCIHCGGGDGV